MYFTRRLTHLLAIASLSAIAGAQQIANRSTLNTILNGGQITDNFETYTGLGSGSATMGTDILTSSSVINGQGPGLVNSGGYYESNDGATELQWNGAGYFGQPSQDILSDYSQLDLFYPSNPQDVGFNLGTFAGYGDTAYVYVYDTSFSVIYSTSIANSGASGEQQFFGYHHAEGIGVVVVVSANNTWSPIVDNNEYGEPYEGNWTHLANAMPEDSAEALQLTDGSVLVHSLDNYNHYYKLTPDNGFSYVNGTWTATADSNYGRLYGQSAVLSSGRVFESGGEYVTGTSDYNTAETYNPVSNTWRLESDSLDNPLGISGYAELPNGNVLCSNDTNTATDFFNPSTRAWSPAGNMASDTGFAESWELLPDGSVLNVYNIGQRYLPGSNAWVNTAALPVPMLDSNSIMGPILTMPNGNALCLGGSGHTLIYTPPSVLANPGTMTQGPDLPFSMDTADAPACVMANGKILCVGATALGNPANFFVYDPSLNIFSQIAGPEAFPNGYVLRMLPLPTGRVLLSGTSAGDPMWVFNPTGGPQGAWRPSPKTVAHTINGIGERITGTNLNGVICGANYNCASNAASNYPLVVLVDSHGQYHYCRSYSFSTMGVHTGSKSESFLFDVPSGLAHANYTMYVIASGIPSLAVGFKY